jgi:hypothetical protein
MVNAAESIMSSTTHHNADGIEKENKHNAENMETEDNAEENPTKKAKTTDPKDIARFVTTDLWSDDPAVVGKALSNIRELADSDENVKTIRSLAGHMMVVASLKKHILVQDIIEDGICSLYSIAYGMGDDVSADAAVLEALRSAGTIDVVLQAIETDKTNAATVEFGFELLLDLIGDSYDAALLFNNSTTLKDKNFRGFGLIALVMKAFPLGCTCGLPNGDNNNCGNKNQVHVLALRLLKCLAQHQDFRFNILVAGCAAQVVSCLEKISTSCPIKSPLEWECLRVLQLASTYDSEGLLRTPGT